MQKSSSSSSRWTGKSNGQIKLFAQHTYTHFQHMMSDVYEHPPVCSHKHIKASCYSRIWCSLLFSVSLCSKAMCSNRILKLSILAFAPCFMLHYSSFPNFNLQMFHMYIGGRQDTCSAEAVTIRTCTQHTDGCMQGSVSADNRVGRAGQLAQLWDKTAKFRVALHRDQSKTHGCCCVTASKRRNSPLHWYQRSKHT